MCIARICYHASGTKSQTKPRRARLGAKKPLTPTISTATGDEPRAGRTHRSTRPPIKLSGVRCDWRCVPWNATRRPDRTLRQFNQAARAGGYNTREENIHTKCNHLHSGFFFNNCFLQGRLILCFFFLNWCNVFHFVHVLCFNIN